MEVQLQELVEKIKKDGVTAAETKAAEIIQSAEAKAADIVRAAETEADRIIQKAKEESAKFESAAVSSLNQASRNTLISFRDSVSAELNSIIKSETAKNYNSEILKKLIPEAVKEWIKKNDTDDLTVILSSDDVKTLEGSIYAALKEKIAAGIEIKADAKMHKGFRIGTKDGAAYYDFSAEAVADLFSAYLSPRTAEILKSASKEM